MSASVADIASGGGISFNQCGKESYAPALRYWTKFEIAGQHREAQLVDQLKIVIDH